MLIITSVEDQRPRVAFVVHDAGQTWGVGTALRELVAGASDRYRFVVVSTRLRDDLRGRVEFVRVPAPAGPFRLRWAVFFCLAALRLRRVRADLIHAVSYGPVVPTADLASVFFDHAAYQERRGGAKSPLARLTVAIDRWGYGRARMLAALAPGGARELERRYAGTPVVVTPYVVDTARFHPDAGDRAAVRSEQGVGEGEVVAVFVNNDVWQLKGLTETITAFAAARAAAPDLAWLWVVGSGPTRRFAQIAAEHGVGVRVRFLGFRHDIERLLRGADVFVLPTLFETFSLGVHEAAATGLPVISTLVFGVEDLIGDGAAGIPVAQDRHEVASALQRLALDAGLRQRLGRQARARATAFTPERWVSANVAAYERLLGR
jgi:glycosyltransferase involved in cell wall biosynthesis